MSTTIETGQVPSPEQMANRAAIENVLFVHCRGVDRACAETLKSAYWQEAEVAYGSFDGNAHEFCGMLAVGVTRYRATHHQVSNIIVDFTGDNAVVESYVTAYHHEPEGDASEMTYFGRYVDHMQRRNNIWKIMFRRVVMDWNQDMATNALPNPTLKKLAKSGRKPNDPLYEMQAAILN